MIDWKFMAKLTCATSMMIISLIGMKLLHERELKQHQAPEPLPSGVLHGNGTGPQWRLPTEAEQREHDAGPTLDQITADAPSSSVHSGPISNDWRWSDPGVRTSFVMPDDVPTTNDQMMIYWHGQQILRCNSNYTAFTFYSTNLVVRYLDASNRVWSARWLLLEQEPEPEISFMLHRSVGFSEGPSNTINVVWCGSNIFSFKGKLEDTTNP